MLYEAGQGLSTAMQRHREAAYRKGETETRCGEQRPSPAMRNKAMA